MSKSRTRQFTLSVKVTAEEKTKFAARCERAGMTQSDMLLRALVGNVPPEHDMPAIARAQLMLVHQLHAALANGHPVDAGALQELCTLTRELIRATRDHLDA